MFKFTKEEYQKAIPDCCKLRTAEDHYEELMWCWGLLSAMEDNKPMDCNECEFRRQK